MPCVSHMHMLASCRHAHMHKQHPWWHGRALQDASWCLDSAYTQRHAHNSLACAQRREAAGGGYVHGKGGTHWRPLFNAQGEFLRPRFAIEVL